MASSKDHEVPPGDEHRHRERREKREKRKSRSDKSRHERDEEGSRVHRHRTSRKSKLSSADSDSHSSHSRRHRKDKERDLDDFSELPAQSSVTDLVPELMSRAGSSVPYPSFSKAHSKEDVSRLGRTEPLTPDATDLGAGEEKKRRSQTSRRRSKSVDHSTSRKSSAKKEARPPTPPDTDLSKLKAGDDFHGPAVEPKLESTLPPGVDEDRPRSSLSGMSKSTTRDTKSRVSTKSSKSRTSSQATFKASDRPPMPGVSEVQDGESVMDSMISDSRTASTSATKKKSSRLSTTGKVKKKKKRPKMEELEEQSPESAPDSSPKTPTVQTPQFPPPPPPMGHEKMPTHNIPFHSPVMPIPPIPPPMLSQTPMTDMTGFSAATGFTDATGFSAAAPPPPPPPPLNIQEAPRVDYLLSNGGLPQQVPRTFLSVIPRHSSYRPVNPPLAGCETLFAPFFNLLEQYQSVMNKQGSIAVATGHRTVARRLLDRLENVFSRDLPPTGCSCVMCDSDGIDHHGLGWGEVLERVSGRVDLPSWPPFDISTLGSKPDEGAADLPHRPNSPISLDPDIAPEFRDHYIRQTKKVKASVDKWLTKNEEHAPMPQDIDDDTLAFTILTSLDKDDRPYFNALLAGSRELQPALRAPTPMKRPRVDFIIKCGLSIQRLYRLSQVPRDAETALYLINNPHVHDLIVTISDINPSEWEILTSGRFDGFLWSGADEDALTPTAENPSRGATPAFPPTRGTTPANIRVPSAMGSRTTTPFGPYSRGPTPASFVSIASTNATNRAAVSNDEETELAVLAEVEREIYQGMEALEDAFETLHHRAELVRTALRNRGAALSMSLQQRRAGFGGAVGGGIDVLPGSGNSMYSSYEKPPWAPSTDEDGSESDWGGDDYEIRPDDSASNVASNRHRKMKRRDERRTPAPIAEDEEEA
ncbi:hypothetical protein MKZ38_004658 [Zalerion maritima]|uniref:5-methylcytosine g t mismatch-specific dna n=1 Tax=Zalerion maritima TaxID=339359 RepID=A0AAD5WPF2_9PEZI|nr:hypothetical protein MKZ38_004658 [Zalerion maritima]